MAMFPFRSGPVGNAIGRVQELLLCCGHADMDAGELSFLETLEERIDDLGEHMFISIKQWEAIERIEQKLNQLL